MPEKYYLSEKACLGILNRAERRNKPMPPLLWEALIEVLERRGGVLSIRERAGKPGGGKGLLIGEDAAFTIATVPNSFVCYDCRGNGDGHTVPTLTGDHQNRVTDYTACVVHESHPNRLPVLETMQSFGEYKELGVASG